MKKILFLSSSIYTFPGVQHLVDGGFQVLLVDKDSDSPGKKIAHQFRPIDIKDSQRVLEWARQEKVDGIMAINDAGTRTAAYVAQRLGLAGLDPQVVEIGNDKGLMRDCWAQANLPIPHYQVISDYEGLEKAVRHIQYPCVLKPTDCDGSGKGISVIRSEDDLRWAYDFAAPFVKNNRFIVEEFIEGTEMTVECFSHDGKVYVLAMSDKHKPDIRTRVATSLNYTANFSDDILSNVMNVVEKAVLAVGVREGMSHTEVIVSSHGVVLVEIGVRPGGGYIFHTIIEAVSGINAPVQLANLLTGNPVNLGNIQRRGAVYRFFNPPKGVLKSVNNIEPARAVKGVVALEIIKKKGELVGDLKNSLERAGFVVTTGQNRQEAVQTADLVEKMVEFIVE